MSSRIIRAEERVKKLKVTSAIDSARSGAIPQDHVMNVEKQAFEQGYKEGERMGKQMGERMIETVVKRYERNIVELAISHKALVAAMERETVKLALEISKKLVRRELSVDPDLAAALVTYALKRIQGHQQVTVRVSTHDCERVRSAIQYINPDITVTEDPSLERGDFVLDTAQTHLDGRILNQIENVGRALLEE